MIDVNVYKGHNDMFNGKNNDCWKSILPLINWFNRPSASTYTNNNKNARQGTKIITKEEEKRNEKGDIALWERQTDRQIENLIEYSSVLESWNRALIQKSINHTINEKSGPVLTTFSVDKDVDMSFNFEI